MRPSTTSVAVRQQPSIETESPTAAAVAVCGASTSSRTPSGPPSRATTRPRSRTIPVNTPSRLTARSVLAERERLEGLADEHLVLAAILAELGEELLDRLRLA